MVVPPPELLTYDNCHFLDVLLRALYVVLWLISLFWGLSCPVNGRQLSLVDRALWRARALTCGAAGLLS